MNKAQRVKQKRIFRHKKRRKNKSKNINPFESIIKERDKQMLKAVKIKGGKIEKKQKEINAYDKEGNIINE